jgi:hypothetical protein
MRQASHHSVARPTKAGLVAALRQIKASRARADPAHERAPRADPPPCAKEHDRVCSLESKVERGVVVAVGDPVVAGEQSFLLLARLGLGRLGPAWQPEVEVETNDGEAGLRRQRSRERTLPRPGHAGHHDAASDGDRSSDVAHSDQGSLKQLSDTSS